jgi:large subunit ribosomal protein L20
MPRVKGGVTALKRRKNVLKQTKGFRFGRSTKERAAKDALMHAGRHAYRHRRDKKGEFRRLWNVKIGAALSPFEISYSKFINMLKVKNVELDRKVLSQIAETEPETFTRIVEQVK